VQVLVKDSRKTSFCKSILDPHVTTFDGVLVQPFTYFIVYRLTTVMLTV